MESLVFLMEKYGIDGGTFWRWTSFDDDEDKDPSLAQPVKRRGVAYAYNSVYKEVLDLGGYHLGIVPNGSFEDDANRDNVPDQWTIAGRGTGLRYFLPNESGQPEVPSRGSYALRLVTGTGTADSVSATSTRIAVSPEATYTTTFNLRFHWVGDPNPRSDPATRPQVSVTLTFFDCAGLPSSRRARDIFRFYEENGTDGFDTFPLLYRTPSDACYVRVEVTVARNGLPAIITLDVDNVR